MGYVFSLKTQLSSLYQACFVIYPAQPNSYRPLNPSLRFPKLSHLSNISISLIVKAVINNALRKHVFQIMVYFIWFIILILHGERVVIVKMYSIYMNVFVWFQVEIIMLQFRVTSVIIGTAFGLAVIWSVIAAEHCKLFSLSMSYKGRYCPGDGIVSQQCTQPSESRLWV